MIANQPLSQRQQQIAMLVASGASNKEIARDLGISEKTVKNTLTRVFVKTNTLSRTQLAVLVVRAAQAAFSKGTPINVNY